MVTKALRHPRLFEHFLKSVRDRIFARELPTHHDTKLHPPDPNHCLFKN
jgi:hypothetical protein